MLHGGAAQFVEKCGRFWSYFAHVFKAAIEAVFGLHGWLGGGAHDDAAAVVLRQFFDGLHNGQQKIERQHLRFVEDDDGACDVMQFAAARGAVGKEGFEELHGGGHDNRRVPVFRGKAQFVFSGFVLQFAVVKGAMVFQHSLFAQFAKGFAKFGGILFDDAGERDDVNHAPHIVLFGVFQRECHGSESFTAAGRHGERKQPLRLCRLFYGIIQNFTAQAI